MKLSVSNKLVEPATRLDPISGVRVEVHVPDGLREAEDARVSVDDIHERGVATGQVTVVVG